jgi:peptide-methionine (S)-S-oxide reductase
VCTGQSGHAEVVQLEFDASKVTYETLLEAFWNLHDPTTLNRQGPDTGTQYRSAIFFHNSAQETTARESKEKLQQSGKFSRDIVTEIVAAPQYYRAEDYHQKYLEKRGMKNCH